MGNDPVDNREDLNRRKQVARIMQPLRRLLARLRTTMWCDLVQLMGEGRIRMEVWQELHHFLNDLLEAVRDARGTESTEITENTDRPRIAWPHQLPCEMMDAEIRIPCPYCKHVQTGTGCSWMKRLRNEDDERCDFPLEGTENEVRIPCPFCFHVQTRGRCSSHDDGARLGRTLSEIEGILRTRERGQRGEEGGDGDENEYWRGSNDSNVGDGEDWTVEDVPVTLPRSHAGSESPSTSEEDTDESALDSSPSEKREDEKH